MAKYCLKPAKSWLVLVSVFPMLALAQQVDMDKVRALPQDS